MAIYKGEPTKDGRIWYFMCYKKDFDGTNKKYKSKKYLRKADAEEAERIFLMKKESLSKHNFDLIAKDFFDSLYKIRKESTVYSYEACFKKNIKPYFERLDIEMIDVSKIRDWCLKMEKKGFKIRYLNKLYNILNLIFKFAIKNYGLNYNPVMMVGNFEKVNEDIIKDEEKIRYITFDDFKIFVSTIDDILWKTFFNFLFFTGMRKGEVQALTWKDINFEQNEIKVVKTLSVKTKNKEGYKITSTKNYKNRIIQMDNALINSLKQYKEEMKKYTDFSENWFVFGNSRFLPQTTIDREKTKYFKLCGIHEITIHEFRHSHVTMLVNEYIKLCNQNKVEIDAKAFFTMTAGRMGHSIEVMERTYLHLFPQVQNDIVNLLNNLNFST